MFQFLSKYIGGRLGTYSYPTYHPYFVDEEMVTERQTPVRTVIGREIDYSFNVKVMKHDGSVLEMNTGDCTEAAPKYTFVFEPSVKPLFDALEKIPEDEDITVCSAAVISVVSDLPVACVFAFEFGHIGDHEPHVSKHEVKALTRDTTCMLYLTNKIDIERAGGVVRKEYIFDRLPSVGDSKASPVIYDITDKNNISYYPFNGKILFKRDSYIPCGIKKHGHHLPSALNDRVYTTGRIGGEVSVCMHTLSFLKESYDRTWRPKIRYIDLDKSFVSVSINNATNMSKMMRSAAITEDSIFTVSVRLRFDYVSSKRSPSVYSNDFPIIDTGGADSTFIGG
jgi:hypothetical protein